jgi:8-oxo-dGTP diphosphatase
VTASAGGVNFCLQCGGPMETRELYGRERAVCPTCGYIHFRNPTPVAGCVVEHDGQIVLVRRGIEPGRGMWGIPAGFMEWGETAEEGAMRETAEETGLTVRIERLLGVYSFVTPYGSGVIIFYVATAISGVLLAGDDAEQAATFAPGAWPDASAFPTHRQALADYLASTSRR